MVDRNVANWAESRQYVFATLANIENQMHEVTKIAIRMDKEWSYLKGKLAVLAAVVGMAAALVMELIIKLLSKV